ncbi:hypothetical protein [Agriterribacter sp.]|uniref:hypothetical protein n=1 Tax=Agriterribacter sp. TaxID=2821509 RepID=UPI002C5FB2AB|nr:hypothetical protein [Agriterribacter sp.]HTN06830.1 hypothetical protein [Agriterribacter sp.]
MNKRKQSSKGTLLTLVFITIMLNCYSQKKPLKNNDFRDIDKLTSLYADSLSYLFKDSIVPNFLFENNFDFKPLYWAGMHKPISLRYLVLKKVKDVDVLEYLIGMQEPRLKLLPETDSPIPFKKYSFYDLILYRINEIRTTENYKLFKKQVK